MSAAAQANDFRATPVGGVPAPPRPAPCGVAISSRDPRSVGGRPDAPLACHRHPFTPVRDCGLRSRSARRTHVPGPDGERAGQKHTDAMRLLHVSYAFANNLNKFTGIGLAGTVLMRLVREWPAGQRKPTELRPPWPAMSIVGVPDGAWRPRGTPFRFATSGRRGNIRCLGAHMRHVVPAPSAGGEWPECRRCAV